MADNTHCPWIRVKDFLEVSLWVSLTNATTRSSLTAGEKVELTEFTDNGLTLKLPKRICAAGHLLLINLKKQLVQPFTPNESPKYIDPMEMTAKVVAIEPFDKDSNLASLKFIQFPEAEWKKLLESFAKRQDAVAQTLQKIRG